VTARAFADPTIWSEVCSAAATVIGAEGVASVPVVGPSRDNWSYFLGYRLSDHLLEHLVAAQKDLAVGRAQEVGLLNRRNVPSQGRRRTPLDSSPVVSTLQTMQPRASAVFHSHFRTSRALSSIGRAVDF
jgi:hypothetical protein